jgi:hypothetical protein
VGLEKAQPQHTGQNDEWFTVVGKELQDPGIHPGNVYNMDETGILLGVLNSLKVLVSSYDLSDGRGAGVQRTLITAIECTSGSSKSLPLLTRLAYVHTSEYADHSLDPWLAFRCFQKRNTWIKKPDCIGCSTCLIP